MHQDEERLRERRRQAAELGTSQLCLIRVHLMLEGETGTKRARSGPVDPGTEYLKSTTFGGRGNFLPARAPVIFKRSIKVPLLMDLPGREPEIRAKV